MAWKKEKKQKEKNQASLAPAWKLCNNSGFYFGLHSLQVSFNGSTLCAAMVIIPSTVHSNVRKVSFKLHLTYGWVSHLRI